MGVERGRDEGEKIGYTRGYDKGKTEGWRLGLDAGLALGEDKGYENGYYVGAEHSRRIWKDGPKSTDLCPKCREACGPGA